METEIFSETLGPIRNFSSSSLDQDDHDLIVFSHLRWDFVFQRPHHLITRFSKNRRVYFIEEPHFTDSLSSSYERSARDHGLNVIIPKLPSGLNQQDMWEELKLLVDQLIETERISDFTSWYYTPMALPFSRHLRPSNIVFDCMDELSAFKNAPSQLLQLEAELMETADVVFTGGHALYEAKCDRHGNIHSFPSSIDAEHFRKARVLSEPEDQKKIPHPRIGFFGVIDERMDIELIEKTARLRPDWNFVMIGPVMKIHPEDLPKLPNIHYLGKRDYRELPAYLSGWDLAILPFARNESTRFISPTKTPEYLAAGRPVVSTSIQDVIRPYAHEDLVFIADTPEEFVQCAEKAMARAKSEPEWLQRVDAFLGNMSWDVTFQKMSLLERKARRIAIPPSQFSNNPFVVETQQMRL